jgi:hypothetical protein
LLLADDQNGTLYALDGGAWTPVIVGPAMSEPRLFDDPGAGRVLLVGQATNDLVAGDVWAYDGASVTRVPLADPDGVGAPPDESYPAVGFDPKREAVLLYGGERDTSGGSTQLDQTWELRQAAYHPALACQFRFDRAEAGDAALLGVSIAASGGADPGGVQLDLWSGGAWTTVDACDGGCPASSPAPLSYSTTDPTQLASLVSDLQTVGVAVASSANNGAGQAEVAAGPVQVTVTFRLP